MTHKTVLAAAFAGLALSITPAAAGVVFSEGFESPRVVGFEQNTVPDDGLWIGSGVGFNALFRGLYNENFSWPATAPFTTPYGEQAFFLNYQNTGLTTAVGATGQTLTAGVTYRLTFHTASPAGSTSANYKVELVAFSPTDDNTARKECRTGRPGTVLATSTGPVTTTDMSAIGTITFTPDGSNAHLGKDLGIRLLYSGSSTTYSTLYDNIRLVVGHDMNPSPASGAALGAAGNVTLSWTNMPPVAPASNTPVDVWFGTNPASLTQEVDGQLVSSKLVSAPAAGTYYWRVDSHTDGDPNGTPVTGDLFFFTISDTDGDGLPDAYELLHTTPASATSLDPAADLEPDGLTNAQEYFYGSDPSDADSDDDTLNDGPEIAGVGSRPPTSPVAADTDGDGLSDLIETSTGTWAGTANTGTNPVDPDTDHDGLWDKVETNTGTVVSRFNTGTNPFLADTDSDDAGDYYETNASFTSPFDPNDKPAAPYPLPDPDGTPPVTTKPVKIFIMSGQSNMVGVGLSQSAEPGSLGVITKQLGKFPNLLDASGNYLPRNDVWFEGTVNPTTDKWLSVGCGSRSDTIGPELGFGAVMGWYYDEPVILLKCAQGNRSLGYDFLPPGNPSYTIDGTTRAGYGQSPMSWPEGSTPVPDSKNAGLQYDQSFLNEADMSATSLANGAAGTNAVDVLDNFATKFPDWASQGFEIAGFVWWQGHKDGGEQGTTPAGVFANRYEDNLVSLIDNLRSYYANRYPGKIAENAPFVVATVGFGGGAWDPGSSAQTIYDAQMAISDPAKHPQYAGTVASVDTTGYWRPFEESPGKDGFHYFNNAETYTLAGDAMARAMIALQDDGAPPAPNPLTFAIAPTAVDPSTIGMVATTASDVSGPVQYYFENTTNSDFRDWSTGPRWDHTGLTTGVTYSFRVKARDAKGNEGDWSAVLAAAPGTDATKPSPDPMSFAAPLSVLGENSIAMTATTATDINGVEYFFECTVGGGPDSPWQASPTFIATGLTPDTPYTYVVRARDSLGNTTGDSSPASATTLAPDTTPPTPGTMSFASSPTAQGTDSISMTAVTASDPSGVQYSFEETSGHPGGTSSGWQDSPSYTDDGLEPGTQYTYRVQARDKSPAAAANNWSLGASATTEVPDITPPTVVTFSPSNGVTNAAVNSLLTITFDEEITTGTGFITLKNLTDDTQITIDVSDGARVSAAGAVLTIDPPADLAYQKQYAVQIADTAIDDLSDNSFDGILNDATWVFTTASAPVVSSAVIYEPFANSDPSLNGNAAGTGLSGNWTGSANVLVSSGTATYGSSLPTSGNKMVWNDDNSNAGSDAASVTVGSGLSSSGLLAHGATLWFSVLYNRYNMADESFVFTLGSDAANSSYGIDNSGSGIGFSISQFGQPAVGTWSGGARTLASTTGLNTGGTLNATLFVGKIVWGADGLANDTIELYLADSGLNLGTAISTGTVVVDQSGFDTLSFVRRHQAGRTGWELEELDEIRFGNSYESVIGAVAGGDDYSTWATDNGIPGQPFSGDINNDGITNGVAYALGLSPTASSQPAGVLSGNTITFTKGADAIANDDVTWIIETSETLAADSWADAVIQSNTNNDPTIFHTFTPGPGTPKKFARLRVVQAAP